MIGRITGSIVEKRLDQLLIDVAGLAYEVEIPMTTYEKVGVPDDQVLLYTHLVVREDAHLLYGFATKGERELFRALIKVNGVGPRVALSIQSSMDSDSFVRCIREDNVKALTALPGIGKKTAERLIIEMRDRLDHWELDQAPQSAPVTQPSTLADAESALVGLGYKPAEAALALSRIDDPDADVPNLIRQALRKLSVGISS
ncbi:MAG: Holliday junction branch migration protein RuvA [Proteobacteria bacterium]|jgi:Holliday junction DNA helicase RuvA|nr:Holliday junction branch migration protein RuvA [Pseudomonadota bacterium]